MKTYYVYIMANKNNNVLYTGMTNNLTRRAKEHKSGNKDGFTKKYKCKKLVWYKTFNNVKEAIAEEKRMKKWKRNYKENVINKMNNEWKDLYYNLRNGVPVRATPAGENDRNDMK